MQTSLLISPNMMLIECLLIPSGGTTQQKNPFGPNMQLQNHKVIAIEALSNQDIAYSPITTGTPVIPANVFSNGFLSLYTAAFKQGHDVVRPEGLWYDQIPLARLRTINNYNSTAGFVTSGSNQILRIQPTEVSWTKSYVACPNSVAITVTYSALFLVHYLNIGDDGRNYM